MKKLLWLFSAVFSVLALSAVTVATAQEGSVVLELPATETDQDTVGSADAADVEIISPVDGSEFQAGSTLELTADAPVDAEVRWDVIVVTGDATETLATALGGVRPRVELPATGTVLDSDALVVVTATALLSDGGSSVDRVTLVPETVQLTFRTIPSGFPMILDGAIETTPFTITTVAGAEHAVEPLASQCDGENSWVFQLWFNGSWAGKVIEVPTFDTTLTAKYGLAVPCDDTTDPIGLISGPASGTEVEMPFTVEGLAVDNHSVGAVRLAVQDIDTGLWWSGSSWERSWRWLDTRLATPGARSTNWQYRLDAGDDPGSGNYRLSAWTLDSSNNIYLHEPGTDLHLRPEVDDIAPTGEVVSPAVGERSERPILAFGTAADPAGISRVGIEIHDTVNDQWWDGAGWVDARTDVATVLAEPGGTETSWTYYFDAPLGSGSYTLVAVAEDTLGNAAPIETLPRPFFTAESAVQPEGAMTLPEDGGRADSPTILAGTAADDTGVEAVSLGIQDLTTGQWWFGDGFGTTFGLVDAALIAPGSPETDWLYAFDPDGAGGSGTYRVDVWVRDVDGLLTTPTGVGSSFSTPTADGGTDPGSGGDGGGDDGSDGTDPGSGTGSGSDGGAGDGGDGTDPGSGGDGSGDGGNGTDPGTDPGDGTEPAGIGRMLVSAFADRSDAVELEQATLEGVSYMFFAPHDPSTAIERVTFWLDDPSMSTAPSQVEVHPPYDFGGGGPFGRNGNGPTDAWDYDTSRLADGLHTMTVRVDLADGTEAVVDTVFYVANGRISARAATPEPVAEAAPMQLLRTVLATLAE